MCIFPCLNSNSNGALPVKNPYDLVSTHAGYEIVVRRPSLANSNSVAHVVRSVCKYLPVRLSLTFLALSVPIIFIIVS